jgi:hypothetical protein
MTCARSRAWRPAGPVDSPPPQDIRTSGPLTDTATSHPVVLFTLWRWRLSAIVIEEALKFPTRHPSKDNALER